MPYVSSLIHSFIDSVEQPSEFGADPLKLFVVQSRKLLQSFFAARGELNQHLAPIFLGRCARHQFLKDQPVNQTNHTMMAKLQPLRQFTNRDGIPPRKALDGQQGLVLLGRDARVPGGFFAEMDESPKRITEGRQRFILFFAKFCGRCHHFRGYH